MEDSHIIDLSIASGVSLFAIFDGHGGKEVSKFCELNFTKELLKNEKFKNK